MTVQEKPTFDKNAEYRISKIEAWGVDPLKARIIENSIHNIAKISKESKWCTTEVMLGKLYEAIGEVVGVNLIKDKPPE